MTRTENFMIDLKFAGVQAHKAALIEDQHFAHELAQLNFAIAALLDAWRRRVANKATNQKQETNENQNSNMDSNRANGVNP